MRKLPEFKVLLLLIIVTSCNNQPKNKTSTNFFKEFVNEIQSINLPVTYIVNQENESIEYREVDSILANQLHLEKSENKGAYGWEILGKINNNSWIGIIYNLTYGNNFEKHFSTFDTAGNKIDDLILMTNDVQYFSGVKEGFYQSTIEADYKINVENGFKLFTDEEHQHLVSNKRYYYSYQLTNNGEFDLIYKSEKDLLNDSYSKNQNESAMFIWKNELTSNEIHLEISAVKKEKSWFYVQNTQTEEGVDLIEIKPSLFTMKKFDEQTLGTVQFQNILDTMNLQIPTKIIYKDIQNNSNVFILTK